MSKELKTIKYLLEQCVNENIRKDLLDIEKALKEYELMKQTKIIVADKDISDEDLEKLKNQRMLVGNLGQCEIKPLFDEETQKKLKALEIIKIKKVNVAYLKYHFEKGNGGYREYVRTMNEHCLDYYPSSKTLTKEEYDLLKEVLL